MGNNPEGKDRPSQQNWRDRGHGRRRGGRSNRPNVECYNCSKHGHYAKECYSQKKVEENANLIAEEETRYYGVLLMAYKDNAPDNDTV